MNIRRGQCPCGDSSHMPAQTDVMDLEGSYSALLRKYAGCLPMPVKVQCCGLWTACTKPASSTTASGFETQMTNTTLCCSRCHFQRLSKCQGLPMHLMLPQRLADEHKMKGHCWRVRDLALLRSGCKLVLLVKRLSVGQTCHGCFGLLTGCACGLQKQGPQQQYQEMRPGRLLALCSLS